MTMQELKIFEEKQIRTVWDEVQGKWYFCIIDIVQILAESKEPYCPKVLEQTEAALSFCSTETTVETITDSPVEMSTAPKHTTFRHSVNALKEANGGIWKVEIVQKEVTALRARTLQRDEIEEVNLNLVPAFAGTCFCALFS